MSNNGDALTTTRLVFSRIAGNSETMSGEHSSNRNTFRFPSPRRAGSAYTRSAVPENDSMKCSAESFTTSMFEIPSSEKFTAATRAVTGSRSTAITRSKLFEKWAESTPRPQVRSMQSAPPYRFSAATASLLACSNASGGKIQRAR